MLFMTRTDRERFFNNCKLGSYPNYGDAMYHVRCTNLGVWGDEDALARDAAQVMEYEIRRFEQENGMPKKRLDADEISRTLSFMAAFEAARGGNRTQIEGLLRAHGVDGKMSSREIGAPVLSGRDLARVIRSECRGAPKREMAHAL